LLHLAQKVCTLVVFIIVDILIILHPLGIDVHTTYLSTNLHMDTLNGLLVIAIKPRTKYMFLM
jgi:hypothetical protein